MLAKGTRVALHPATDEWMQGDRFGTVIGCGTARDYRNRDTGELIKVKPYRVKLDRLGRIRRFHPEAISPID